MPITSVKNISLHNVKKNLQKIKINKSSPKDDWLDQNEANNDCIYIYS